MAGYNAGNLEANLRLNMREFTAGLQNATRQVQNVGRQFQSTFSQATNAVRSTRNEIQQTSNSLKDFERIVGGILLSQAFYAGVSAIQDAGAAVMTFSNNMEKAQIALEYFLGSPEAARGFLVNMQDFATDTAFNTEQALSLSRRLMAAQFDPKDVRGVMEILNDASAASGGTAEQMDRIVLAISQIKTNGKIAGQELRQLGEAGIPIYKILQEELGLTGEQVLNIGDLQISGDIGVQALLDGLEKRYKGAADRIADTIPGMWESIKDNSLILAEAATAAPREALSDFLTVWRDTWDEARTALVEGGLGEVLERMVPEELHTSIRLIVGSVKELVTSLGILNQALVPVWQILAKGLIAALGTIMPVISGVVGAFARLVSVAFQSVPGLRYVAAAIVGLIVAQSAAKAVLFLWNVLRLGGLASVVAGAVMQLTRALQWLFLVLTKGHPVVRIITIIAGALLYLAASSKTVSGWLERLMNQLGALGGFDVGEILQPEDIDLGDWGQDFEDTIGGIGEDTGIGDMLDDAGKKGKDAAKDIEEAFTAAFDEVYQIPDDKDKGSGSGGSGGGGPGGGAGGGLPSLGGMPDFGLPDLPREIELPKLVVPPVDWPVVPPMLMKPIKIDFKINWPEWPNLPGPPPAVVTAWQISMDKLRSWGLSWGAVLEGLAAQIPGLIPKLIPVGAGQGIVDWVEDWKGKIEGQFDALKERLTGQWGAAWGGLAVGIAQAVPAVNVAWGAITERLKTGFDDAKTYLSTGAAALLTGMVATFATNGAKISSGFQSTMTILKNAFATAKTSILTGAATMLATLATSFATKGAALSASWKAMSTKLQSDWKAATAAMGVVAGAMWAVIVKTFEDVKGKLKEKMDSIKTSLKEKWDGTVVLIIGIVTVALATIVNLFSGLGGRLVPSASSLAGKVGPGFSAIATRFGTATAGIPAMFSTLLGKLPSAASSVVGKIVGPFANLPELIRRAISNIPEKIASVFAKIKIPNFSVGVGGAIKATATLLGNLAGFKDGGIIDKDSIVRVGEGGRREAIIPLQNGKAMQPYVDAVVRGVMGVTGNSGGSGQDDRPILYVGTLIADDRSLAELDRRMKVVQLNRGGAGR